MTSAFPGERFARAQKRPELSIVIVDSDDPEVTLNCLRSIYENPPYREFEVVLVENIPTSNCVRLINERYPLVRIFIAPQPQGFSRNYNLGIQQTGGDFILILNNDTVVHPGALDALINFISEKSEYGMVGPKLLSSDGKIQTVCARSLITPSNYVLIQFLLDLSLPTGKLWESYRRWRLSNATSGPVACISGACMLTPRRVLNEVGVLDEDYVFYYEDVEWCHRVQHHGLRIGFVAEAEITHLGDQSLSRVKELAKRSEYRGAIRYFRNYHHLNRSGEFCLWAVTLLSYAFRAIVYSFVGIKRRHPYSTTYKRLLRWILGEFPFSLKVNHTDEWIPG